MSTGSVSQVGNVVAVQAHNVTKAAQLGFVVAAKPNNVAKIPQIGFVVAVHSHVDVTVQASQIGYVVAIRNHAKTQARQLGFVVAYFGIPAPGGLTATYVPGEGIRLDWQLPRVLSGYTYKGYEIYRYQTNDIHNGVAQRVHSAPFVFEPLEAVTFTDRSVGTKVQNIGKTYTYYLTTVVLHNQLQIVGQSPTSGGFTLTTVVEDTEDDTTDTIAYNASGNDVQAALEPMSNIGSGNILVTGPPGGPWVVAPINDLLDVQVLLRPNWSRISAGSYIVYSINNIESGSSNQASATFLG